MNVAIQTVRSPEFSIARYNKPANIISGTSLVSFHDNYLNCERLVVGDVELAQTELAGDGIAFLSISPSADGEGRPSRKVVKTSSQCRLEKDEELRCKDVLVDQSYRLSMTTPVLPDEDSLFVLIPTTPGFARSGASPVPPDLVEFKPTQSSASSSKADVLSLAVSSPTDGWSKAAIAASGSTARLRDSHWSDGGYVSASSSGGDGIWLECSARARRAPESVAPKPGSIALFDLHGDLVCSGLDIDERQLVDESSLVAEEKGEGDNFFVLRTSTRLDSLFPSPSKGPVAGRTMLRFVGTGGTDEVLLNDDLPSDEKDGLWVLAMDNHPEIPVISVASVENLYTASLRSPEGIVLVQQGGRVPPDFSESRLATMDPREPGLLAITTETPRPTRFSISGHKLLQVRSDTATRDRNFKLLLAGIEGVMRVSALDCEQLVGADYTRNFWVVVTDTDGSEAKLGPRYVNPKNFVYLHNPYDGSQKERVIGSAVKRSFVPRIDEDNELVESNVLTECEGGTVCTPSLTIGSFDFNLNSGANTAWDSHCCVFSHASEYFENSDVKLLRQARETAALGKHRNETFRVGLDGKPRLTQTLKTEDLKFELKTLRVSANEVATVATLEANFANNVGVYAVTVVVDLDRASGNGGGHDEARSRATDEILLCRISVFSPPDTLVHSYVQHSATSPVPGLAGAILPVKASGLFCAYPNTEEVEVTVEVQLLADAPGRHVDWLEENVHAQIIRLS